MTRWFHTKNGVWFGREADGEIVIAHDPKGIAAIPPEHLRLVRLTPSEFASVFSTMSKVGENYDTWVRARSQLLGLPHPVPHDPFIAPTEGGAPPVPSTTFKDHP